MNATTDELELVAFVNPSSGRHFRDSAALERVQALCRNRATLRIVDSETAMREQVTCLPDCPGLQVAILGGDGTHMRVMSSLMRVLGPSRLPQLVPIPFGTVGTISRRWGSGKSPWPVLSAWLSHEPMVLRRQETLSIMIDDAKQCIGCTVGTGLVAQFFERYESMGARGARAASNIALQSFFGSFVSSPYARSIMKPLECSIAIEENEVTPKQFSLVVSSVFKDVGLGIKVTYKAGGDLGRIALVTSSLPARRLGPQFWRVLTGRPLIDPQGINRLVREWSLKFSDSGPVIIDGDRFNVRSLRVRPGPTWSVLSLIR